MLKKFKNPLIFALVLLPIGLIGGFFTSIYLEETYDPVMLSEMLAQTGISDINVLHIITAVQTAGQILLMSFIGYILAEKIGLLKSFKISKAGLLPTIVLTVLGSIIFVVLEYGVFSGLIPEVAATYEAKPTIAYMISCLTYGGVLEEIMMRWFLLSLLVFIIWKLFFKKEQSAPKGVMIGVNIVVALLFAAGHLPTTAMTMGITPLILVRCFSLNSLAGLICGHLYIKHGIQYAMLSHMGFHILWKIVWILFI